MGENAFLEDQARNFNSKMEKYGVDKDVIIKSDLLAVQLIRLVPRDKLYSNGKPNLVAPFTYGWKRELVYRVTCDSAKSDIYYYPPVGKKLRSLKEIEAYLKNDIFGLTIDHFTMKRKLISKNNVLEKDRKANSLLGTKKMAPKIIPLPTIIRKTEFTGASKQQETTEQGSKEALKVSIDKATKPQSNEYSASSSFKSSKYKVKNKYNVHPLALKMHFCAMKKLEEKLKQKKRS